MANYELILIYFFRRNVWEKNVEKIQIHNLEYDLGLHTYTMGINQYADLVGHLFGGEVTLPWSFYPSAIPSLEEYCHSLQYLSVNLSVHISVHVCLETMALTLLVFWGLLLGSYKWQMLHIFRVYQPDMGPVHSRVIFSTTLMCSPS